MLKIIKSIHYWLAELLIKKAVKEQFLERDISFTEQNSDILNQYNSFQITKRYIYTKVLGLHIFQLIKTVESIKKADLFKKKIKIVDIGDSSGNHIDLFKKKIKDYSNASICSLSINCDSKAINKIKWSGKQAIKVDIEKQDFVKEINADSTNAGYQFPTYCMMFETLEHLENPIAFLNKMKFVSFEGLIISVPFIKKSRVALHQWRNNRLNNKLYSKEDIHVFELSPDDWKLIFKYCGFKIVSDSIYYQYPRKWLWFLFIPVFRKYWSWFDYQGFYCVTLEKEK